MRKYFVVISCLITSCGSVDANTEQIEKPNTENGSKDKILKPDTEQAVWSLKANTADKLPECTLETEGRLAWVIAEKTAYACSELAWTTLDLKGQNGKDGKDGQSIVGEKGVQGDKGDKGETGLQGEQGQKGDKGDKGEQGEQGIQGIAGTNGTNGTNGVTTTVTEIRRMEHLPKARDAQGTVIGDVIYYDTARNHFIAVTPSGLRLRFTSLGAIPAWTVYYKTANCSDTPMVLAESYFFESVFMTQNGLMVKTGLAATQTAAYRKRDGIACELAPSVVTARMFSLRAPTAEESQDLWDFGTTYVD